MALDTRPGGSVQRGYESQESDVYRRTDISRSTQKYLRGTAYPCSESDPAVMVQRGITIVRGAKEAGYPFLSDVPRRAH